MKKRLQKLEAAARLQDKEAGPPTIAEKAFGVGIRHAAVRASTSANSACNAWVALKYYASSFECFSEWNANDLKALTKFLDTVTSCGWDALYRHSGLRLKSFKVDAADAGQTQLKSVHDVLSPDIDFFEFRITQRARVHGFRAADAFFLVLLDKDHRVFPE